MKKNDLYSILINETKEICEAKGYNYAYKLGRIFDYKKRVAFDHKIKCEKIESRFSPMFSLYEHEKEFLYKLIKNDELYYILDNINDIIRNSHCLSNNLLTYLNDNRARINDRDYNNIEIAITKSVSEFYPLVKEEDMKRLRDLLVSVADGENKSLLDIKVFNYGGFSKVYRIGNKIVKIGYKRMCENIVDQRRLLLPYFKDYVGKDFVEITDYLEPAKDISFEEIYSVYKELRDQGIIWLAPNEENLARVDKKTLENNKRKKKEGIGLLKNYNYLDKDLEVGDLLIIDLDHMVYENDVEKIRDIEFDLDGALLERRHYFEERYNNKTKRLVKTNKDN